jgi:hypothetical protein
MKKLFFLLILVAGATRLSAQTEESSCYNQWAKAFEIRGADEVKDGWHDGVIISIRTGSKTKCYTAKVQVVEGAVKEIYIKFVDGKFEVYKPEWKYTDQKASIINGITKTLQTLDDDLINIIFINHLKPKKKAFELAPLPDPDDF